MNTFTAVMIAEGAQDAESEEQYLQAWQTLVDTAASTRGQGFFGRTAARMIEEGLLTRGAR